MNTVRSDLTVDRESSRIGPHEATRPTETMEQTFMSLDVPLSVEQIDPFTFEVLRNAFVATSNEMALVVAKSAYSTPVNEGRDFSGRFMTGPGTSCPRASSISPLLPASPN